MVLVFWMQANSSQMEFAAQQFAIASKLLVLKMHPQPKGCGLWRHFDITTSQSHTLTSTFTALLL